MRRKARVHIIAYTLSKYLRLGKYVRVGRVLGRGRRTSPSLVSLLTDRLENQSGSQEFRQYDLPALVALRVDCVCGYTRFSHAVE